MATIVEGSVPADDFALHHVLEALPEAELEVEQVIESGEQTVMPLVWVHGVDRSTAATAVEQDPSVCESTLLTAMDDASLFQIEWADHIRLLLQMLTNSEATVLDAVGRDGRWNLRVLYPDRDEFSDTHAFCDSHGISFDVESIRELDSPPAERYELTDDQSDTLQLAARRGYFQVPREATLQDLASEMDVSHQALSERLRRGTDALVAGTLLTGTSRGD